MKVEATHVVSGDSEIGAIQDYYKHECANVTAVTAGSYEEHYMLTTTYTAYIESVHRTGVGVYLCICDGDVDYDMPATSQHIIVTKVNDSLYRLEFLSEDSF